MTFRERINQGSSQSHARNSFAALAAVSCAATDALRKSYNSHQEAEVSAFESKQMEIEGKLMPIMQRAYQGAAGGAAGAAAGAGAAGGSAGGHSGPRVEEVD